MLIELKERTEAHVRTYFERAQDAEIRRLMPSAAASADDALRMFHESRQPGAASYGRTIYAGGQYVGDIWCYCIDPADTPHAMLSFCIFEKALWNKGIATAAIAAFLAHIQAERGLSCIGAFAYADNAASIRALERNGFQVMERLTEDGRESVYLQTSLAAD